MAESGSDDEAIQERLSRLTHFDVTDEDTAPFWDPNSEQFPHLSPSAKAAAAAAAGDDDDALAVGLGQHPLDGSGSELEIELSGDGGDAASEVDPADASAAEKTLEQVVADTAEERSNIQATVMTGLLHKLINLDRGVVTDSMVPFLLNERFPSALMAFVHRCDDEAAADDTGEGGSDGPSTSGGAENLLRPVDDYRHPRDEDHVKTLQSYKVVQLLTEPSQAFLQVQSARVDALVTELFRCLDIGSQANLHHFQKLLHHFLTNFTRLTIQTMVRKRLLLKMLNFLHETTTVVPILLSFLRIGLAPDEKAHIYTSLVECGFMDHLRMRMFYPDPAVSDFATVAPFFVRFLDELRFQDASPVLFNTFVGDDIFVSACATAMATAPNDAQKEAAAMVLEKLIKTSREVIAPVPQPEGSPPQPPPTNHLSAITAELTQRIVGALGPIQDTLLDRAWEGGSRKYSAYTVVSGLGAVRYFAVSILAEVVDEDAAAALEALRPAIWKQLGIWFFQFGHNNIYQSLFYRLFRAAFDADHEPSLRALLSKGKFFGKMMSHYLGQERTGARGFILLLMNLIRLRGDSQASNDCYIRKLLISHGGYQDFLPMLRHDTLILASTPSVGGVAIWPQVGPGIRPPPGAVYRCDGIDLGSSYALLLGFDGTGAENAISILDDDAYVPPDPAERAAAAAAVSPSSGKKKKKKKKKKTKNNKNNKAAGDEDGSENGGAGGGEEESGSEADDG